MALFASPQIELRPRSGRRPPSLRPSRAKRRAAFERALLFVLAAAIAGVIFILSAGGAAHAKPGKGNPHAEPETATAPTQTSAASRDNFSVDIGVGVHIGDDEPRIVREYYSNDRGCPPGLAKKRNGCLPPGQAKKLYRVGHPVPDSSIVVELPYGIIVKLPPLPVEREYRLVDGDLAVVDKRSHVVIDARAVF